MSIRLRNLKGCLCAAAGVLLVALAPAQRPVQRLSRVPASGEARVALLDTAGPHVARSQQLGFLAGDTALTSLSLVLKPTEAQDAALTQLLADQQNPASASYHQWLTPEQFGERFGVADADIQLIEQWLQSKGFTVDSVAPSANRIVFSGTAAAAETAFGTSLQRYQRNGREFFENSTPVQLPASLATVVRGVTGLSSYRPPTPKMRRMSQATASPDYTTSTGTHYIVPDDLRTIYGTDSLIGAGYNGSGIKIGIIGESAVDTTQLTYFQQKTGQTSNLPTMVLVPGTGNSNRVDGDESESELDLEYAGGNAPGASLQFIYTGCTSTTSSSVLSSSTNCGNNGVFDAIIYAITNNLAPILSLSYGGCEEEDASYANTYLEPALKQANAQGQTIMVSSGDAGAASCETSEDTKVATAGLAVSYPASSVYVTGVGGTQLTSDSSTYWSSSNNSYLGSALGYIPETAWNDTAAYGSLSASGGGLSQLFTKPSWQVGTGVPTANFRAVPDVAFPANVSEHALLTCTGDGPCTSGTKSFTITASGVGNDGGGVGGTSAAAPTFAGMLAVVEQANKGAALGNINPSLYALAEGPSAASIFHDITTGNNIVNCTVGTPNCTTGTLGYSAGVGYDLVTGLGSIAIPALQTALAGYAANSPRIQISAPATVSASTAVTFTATVAGSGSTPTGTVTFSVDGTAVGSVVALSSGTASYTYSGFTSTGSHTVSVAYAGDGTYGTGTASTIVTATILTPSLALAASPSTVAINTPLTVTATLTGSGSTPTGSVAFAVDGGTATTVAVVNGTASYPISGFATAGLHVVSASYTSAGSGSTAIYAAAQASLNLIVSSPSQTLTPTLQLSLVSTSVAPGATLAATVKASGTGTSAPTGNVTFSIDGNGTAATSTLASGSATASFVAPTTVGTHTVSATYYGDNTYKSATSSATVTVVNPGISVAVTPSTLTAAFGSTTSGTLTVTSVGSAAGAASIKLSLVSYTGATSGICYGLNPASPTVPANGSVTSTLTLYTTLTSCNPNGNQLFPPTSASSVAPLKGVRLLAWAGLPLPFLLFLLRRRVRSVGLLTVLAVSCCLGLSSCGSGGTPSSGTTTTTTTGTGTTTTTSSTAASYVIRVTAVVPNPSGTLSATTTFTFNVQ